MKKTLVAIAALAASVGAMAQSSITLFGTLDPSIQNQKTTYNNGTAVKQNTLANNRRGTSQISARGIEDLGGGLRANFMYEGDFDASSQAGATNGIGNGGGEIFAGLSGGFGSLKIGAPNTPTLTAQASRQPIGTKLGSGFGATGVLGTAHVRESKSLVYATPNLGGFNGSLGYTFGTNADSIAPATAAKPKTDLGLGYANGPINVGLALFGQSKDAAGNGNKLMTVYGQYDLGIVNLYAGLHNETKTAANVDSKSSGVNFGFKAPIGGSGVTLLGNFGKLNDKTAANLDKTIFALGGEYALSKRSNLYTRFVKESNKNNTLANAVNGVQSMFLGVQHNF